MKAVQETLHQFINDLRGILKEDLYEIIIHGSYVLDDFRPGFGDLDFLVLCEENLDEKANRNLSSLHAKYRADRMLLMHQLEGTYYPKSFMKNPEASLSGFYVGTTRVKSITRRHNSYMDLSLIHQRGLMLLGSNCATYNPSRAELASQLKSDCQSFKSTMTQGSMFDSGFWVSLIHWCARTLYYRANGRIGSKTEACKWCLEQSALSEFHDLFNFAKSLRFPYGQRQTSSETKEKSSGLLDLVDTWNNDQSSNRIEPASTGFS